jgi:hypothetical protein
MKFKNAAGSGPFWHWTTTAPDLAIEFNRGGWTMAVQGKEFTGAGI